MKHIIAIILATAIFVSGAASVGYGATAGITHKVNKAGNCYTTSIYHHGKRIGKVKSRARLKVRVVNSKKVNARTLKNRRDNYIIVEVIRGKCTDDAGNGKTSSGHYISYKRVKGHRKGARYTTYAIYGNNNSIDDIVSRFDVRGGK